MAYLIMSFIDMSCASTQFNPATTQPLLRTVYVARQTDMSEKLPHGYGETLEDLRSCLVPIVGLSELEHE
jgi:hypothetical protein